MWKKSRYGYALCCERGTSENFCPWALAPDTKFSLILLPSFTGGLLSHKCHPPFFEKKQETGLSPIYRHNRTHHICSQCLGQGAARWPCITAREPWGFKLYPRWPRAQKILGGIYECAQSGRVDRGSTRSPTTDHTNRKQWLPLFT